MTYAFTRMKNFFLLLLLVISIRAGISASALGFVPGGWDFYHESGIGPRGWDLGLKAGIWGSRLLFGTKTGQNGLKNSE